MSEEKSVRTRGKSRIRAVGFVGLGMMGSVMAPLAAKAGYELHVHARTRSKAARLVEAGAIWHDTPGDLALACDAVVTVLRFPVDVRQVYLGPEGLIARARPGTLLVDTTTSNPSLARLIWETAAARGIAALDAPVSGGPKRAASGSLAIMVGGEAADFERALPLLRVLGLIVHLMGPAGSGQHAKIVSQIVYAASSAAIAEGLAYARQSGLDAQRLVEILDGGIVGGPLWEYLAARMVDREFEPGLAVHYLLKDLGIAIEESARMGLDLPVLGTTRERFEELAALGYGAEGAQSAIRLYDNA